MTTILNFKKNEVAGYSLDEVKSQVNYSLDAKGANATQAFKNWKAKQTGAITDAMVKEWMIEHLNAKFGNAVGLGCYIVVTAPSADKRQRPYERTNVKNEDGKRDWDTVYTIKGVSGTVYGTVTPKSAKVDRLKKSDADAVVKSLYSDKTITEDVDLYIEKTPRNTKQSIVAHYKYSPSKSAQIGQYITFGIEA